MTNPTATTCPKCHGAIDPGERFCRNCGTSLSGEQRARTTELDLLQQATLGDYEIIRVLGQGGMATVYLAQDLTLDRKVAIKVISPDVARGAEMIARFRREAKTAAALTHPHIIPIYAVKETQDLDVTFAFHPNNGGPPRRGHSVVHRTKELTEFTAAAGPAAEAGG